MSYKNCIENKFSCRGIWGDFKLCGLLKHGEKCPYRSGFIEKLEIGKETIEYHHCLARSEDGQD